MAPVMIEKAGGFDRMSAIAIEKAGGADNLARVYVETGTGKDDYALVFQKGGKPYLFGRLGSENFVRVYSVEETDAGGLSVAQIDTLPRVTRNLDGRARTLFPRAAAYLGSDLLILYGLGQLHVLNRLSISGSDISVAKSYDGPPITQGYLVLLEVGSTLYWNRVGFDFYRITLDDDNDRFSETLVPNIRAPGGAFWLGGATTAAGDHYLSASDGRLYRLNDNLTFTLLDGTLGSTNYGNLFAVGRSLYAFQQSASPRCKKIAVNGNTATITDVSHNLPAGVALLAAAP